MSAILASSASSSSNDSSVSVSGSSGPRSFRLSRSSISCRSLSSFSRPTCAMNSSACACVRDSGGGRARQGGEGGSGRRGKGILT